MRVPSRWQKIILRTYKALPKTRSLQLLPRRGVFCCLLLRLDTNLQHFLLSMAKKREGAREDGCATTEDRRTTWSRPPLFFFFTSPKVKFRCRELPKPPLCCRVVSSPHRQLLVLFHHLYVFLATNRIPLGISSKHWRLSCISWISCIHVSKPQEC